MSRASEIARRDRLPPRNLTLAYLAFAYLCLGAAFLILVATPQSVGGFFYHPRMLAVVHLVTLGWISSSILGSFHLIGPIALRTVLRPGWADYVACALVLIGVVGLVSHFWIDWYSGMVWSAGTLLASLAHVAVRTTAAVVRAPIQGGVKLHIILAFANLLGAGVLGMLIGLEKQQIHVLPGYLLHTVYAHAHIVALGWATMMVMGTAYRLFPMVLPSAMPKKSRTWASAVLVEIGLIVILLGLPASHRPAIEIGTVTIVAGLLAFFSQVLWMKRHPKRPPKGLRRPDFATWHAMQAVGYLAVASGLGAALAFAPSAAWKIRAPMAYGVFGLIGFLAQMVVGIAARMLPMFSWMHLYVDSEFKVVPTSQYTMHSVGLQGVGFVLWTAGVPALAWGLSFDRWTMISAAAALLLTALVCNAINGVLIVRHAFRA